MKKLIVLVTLIVGFGLNGMSQTKVWTLKECIEHALENNLDIKQSMISVENSAINLQQAKFARYPNLNSNTSFQNNWGRSIDPTTNDFITQQINFFSFGATSSVTLFNGNILRNQILQSESDFEASKFDFAASKENTTLFLVSLYMNVIFNKELLENARAQLNSSSSQVERTQKQVDAGALPRSNLLDLQAQQATNELNVINQENGLNFSLLQLKQLMQLPATTDMDVEVPEYDVEMVDLDGATLEQIYSNSLTTMPQIKAAEYRVQSSDIGVKIAKGNAYPSLAASGGLSTNYSSAADRARFIPDGGDPVVISNPQIGFVDGTNTPVYSLFDQTIPSGEMVDSFGFTDQFSDNLSWFAGVRLNIPIFNRMTTSLNIQRSIVSKDQSDLFLEQAKNDLRQNIETAYNDAVAASKTYTSTQKQVDAREEAFRVTQQRYNLGSADFVEYQISENDLFQAKSDLLRAKYDFILKKKILDFYQGKNLEF